MVEYFWVELSENSAVKKYKKVREVYISPYCQLILVPPNLSYDVNSLTWSRLSNF